MKTKTFFYTFAAIFALVGLTMPSSPGQAPVRDDDINGQPTFKSALAFGDKMVVPAGNYSSTNMMTLIEESPRFTILRSMLVSTGLNETLTKSINLTLFAPTDEAFGKMTKEELDAMMSKENAANLTRLLLFHTSNSILKSEMMTEPVDVKTNADEDLAVTTRVDDGDVVILVGGLAKVIQPNITVQNGVIHAIDRVLFPKRNAEEKS